MTVFSRIQRPVRAQRPKITALAASVLAWSVISPPVLADEALADLVEQVNPAVVAVFITQEPGRNDDARQRPGEHGFSEESPLGDFFRRFGPNRNSPEFRGGVQPRRALGSGFILDAEGFVITNNHVVENAASVLIRLSDDREFTATVVGTDKQTDLALLKIDADEALPFVVLGDSDAMRVGDDVMAVGNPFGLGGTVTQGIISAKGRDIQAGPYVDFIQTDAAINRGNSGGPLFNMQGEVIGVNSAIFSPSGGSVGLGFAIPSNIVADIVADLRQDGKVARGWLGVAIQDVSPEIASAIGMDEPMGALVANVIPDGPSSGTLVSGDVIISFNDAAVRDSRELPRLVGQADAGSRATIGILRNGDKMTVSVEIGTFKTAALATPAPVHEGVASSERLGATLSALTDEARSGLDIGDDVDGALVTSLKAGGAAAKAGLRVGDVIVRVGNTDVSSPSDLDAALSDTDTESALLMVNRRGDPFFVGVRLGT